jgi:hypothetical protein
MRIATHKKFKGGRLTWGKARSSRVRKDYVFLSGNIGIPWSFPKGLQQVCNSHAPKRSAA